MPKATKQETPETPVPTTGRPVPPEEAPPAPSEVADEPVKVGRKNMSAQDADRLDRSARREALHTAYGTTSGKKADEGAPRP